jgi:hypothetical protein
MKPSPEEVRSRVRSGISTIAWVAAEYSKINPGWIDADDYIQTMIVFESLAANGGFNHADLVHRFRIDRETVVAGVKVRNNGSDHKGQMHLLRKSADPLYLAKGGITPGCAMKALPLGVWERDLRGTVNLADAATKVTHGSVEARLSGILAALAYRHALHGVSDPDLLHYEWMHASQMAGLSKSPHWMMMATAIGRAKSIVAVKSGKGALLELLKRVGIMYFAWSCPVSAVFWSYTIDLEFKGLFRHIGSDKRFTIDGKTPLVDQDVLDEYVAQAKMHDSDSTRWLEEPKKAGRMDSDTFFSIAFSIAAVRDPSFLTSDEVASVAHDLPGEDVTGVLDAVAGRWA